MDSSQFNLKELNDVVYIPIEDVNENSRDGRFLTAKYEDFEFSFGFSSVERLADFFATEQFYVQMLGFELVDMLIGKNLGLGFNFTQDGEGNLWTKSDLLLIRDSLKAMKSEIKRDSLEALNTTRLSPLLENEALVADTVLRESNYVGTYLLSSDEDNLYVVLDRTAFEEDGEARFATIDKNFRFCALQSVIQIVILETRSDLWQKLVPVANCGQVESKTSDKPKIPNLRY